MDVQNARAMPAAGRRRELPFRLPRPPAYPADIYLDRLTDLVAVLGPSPYDSND